MSETSSNNRANGLVAVAMSGGVDSSVVAGMLKRDDCEILGLRRIAPAHV